MSDKVTGPETLADWFRRIGTKLSRDDYEDGIAAMYVNREQIDSLTESNRKLANQIVGYGDRMQATIAGIRRDAKVEALREASAAAYKDKRIQGLQRAIVGIWINDRADNLESS